MRAALVIPAYNEERTIEDIARRALHYCETVIVVDDGSTDGTADAIATLPVRLLQHDRNRGKSAALWTGFAAALAGSAEVVLTIDADGQHRPEDIPRLIAAARAYPHCLVVGARAHGRASYPRARSYANRFADFWISWAAGHAIADSQSGERLYPASLLTQISLRRDRASGFTLESEILIDAADLGYDCVSVPIAAIYYPGGRRSHFRPLRDIPRIGAMIARRLLSRGMDLPGLWHSMREPPRWAEVADPVEESKPAPLATAATGALDSIDRSRVGSAPAAD